MRKLALAALCLFALPALADNEVDQRQENQQQRIEQGERSGELTPREADHLENREARTQEQINAERAANGGKLTGRERAQLNREQNRSSRAIYRKKHNDRVR